MHVCLLVSCHLFLYLQTSNSKLFVTLTGLPTQSTANMALPWEREVEGALGPVAEAAFPGKPIDSDCLTVV